MSTETALSTSPQPEVAEPQEASPRTWREALKEVRESDYFRNALKFVEAERRSGKTVYPPNEEIFNAFKYTELADVRVVILGQDPYHGPKQAHGLCFSVRDEIAFPPSLQNIFIELKNDLSLAIPKSGSLEKWAAQGVLLLNTSLTVEAGKPASHAAIGWEKFTDEVIAILNRERSGVVFLLWGAHAQRKGSIVDRDRHIVLTAPHPSPLSASRGFFGCRHFSKTNEILRQQGSPEIQWNLG